MAFSFVLVFMRQQRVSYASVGPKDGPGNDTWNKIETMRVFQTGSTVPSPRLCGSVSTFALGRPCKPHGPGLGTDLSFKARKWAQPWSMVLFCCTLTKSPFPCTVGSSPRSGQRFQGRCRCCSAAGKSSNSSSVEAHPSRNDLADAAASMSATCPINFRRIGLPELDGEGENQESTIKSAPPRSKLQRAAALSVCPRE